MSRHVVGRASDLPPGKRKIVEVEGRSIGVFNVEGRFYALRNQCPHQGAPLCEGHLTGTCATAPPGVYLWERDGEILRCPWHGWEFDLTNGLSVVNPHRLRVRSYEVSVEAEGNEDPSVESYPVTIENALLILHL